MRISDWSSDVCSSDLILQRIGTVLDYAHIEGWRGEEAALRSVRKGLPRQPTQENHFAALPYADVPALVTRLKQLPDTAGRDALLLTILNAVRYGETRPASWSEIDRKGAVWNIPEIGSDAGRGSAGQ